MGEEYSDRWIVCSEGGISIRGYYFPWGAKHVPYGSIKGLERVQMGAFRGQARIWGTANPHYWASYDPKRPLKDVAFIFDLGKFVKPFVTPEDPDRFEAVVRGHMEPAGQSPPGEARPGPLV